MLYGCKTWCLREKCVTILRRAGISIVRAMCSVKLVDKKHAEELVDMSGLWKAAYEMSGKVV